MFPKLLTILIIILILAWLSEREFRQKMLFLKQNWVFLILPILFLTYLIGMSYTDHQSYGWKKIETALALFIIPIIIPTLKSINSKVNYTKFQKWYLNGIIVSMLFCVVRSIILFTHEIYCRKYNIPLESYPHTNYFFSSYLSYFMHNGYYSMYVNVAILVLLETLRENFQQYNFQQKILKFTLLFFLSIYVLMLYSKAAIICLLMIYFCYGIYLTIIYKKKSILVYTFLSLLLLIFLLFKYVPYTVERLDGMINGISQKSVDPSSTESTQLRVFAWKTSKELIKEKPWFGYGTGDGNYILLERYKIKNYTGAASIEINAHNQYYQTMLSIGIIGILILILFFLKMLKIAWTVKNFNIFIFVILSSFILFFESYFSTQAGIFFISIISTFFLIKYYSIS